MATFIHNKSNAFRKSDDVHPLRARRSEGRLKRYTSVTDTRAWMNNALENKRFFCEFMSSHMPVSEPKIIGHFIPVDAIWKVLLTNKNNYIFDLENRIENFVTLLQEINLSKLQVTRIREMCNTTFRSINDYLLKYEITVTKSNLQIMEQGIQAIPRTLNCITETKKATENESMGTVPVRVTHKMSNTINKVFSDMSIDPISRSVCDVCLQVRLPTVDKCVSVKVRVPTPKKPSMINRKTETLPGFIGSEGTKDKYLVKSTSGESQWDSAIGIPMEMMDKRRSTEMETQTSRDDMVFSEGKCPVRMVSKPVIAKSQSEIIKPSSIEPDMPRKSRKSAVTFIDTTNEKAFSSNDSIGAGDLINDIIKSSNSSDMIEVVSQSNQVSEVEDKSVVQLYRSTRTASIVSTLITASDQIMNKYPDIPGDENVNAQTSTSKFTKNAVANTIQHRTGQCGSQTVDKKYYTIDDSTDPLHTKLCSQTTQCSRLRKFRFDEDDDADDKFHDCETSAMDNMEKQDQETQFICCRKKSSPSESSARKQQQVVGGEITSLKVQNDISELAVTAMKQLYFIRKTLKDNKIILEYIDNIQLVKIINSYHSTTRLGFRSFLFECVSFDNIQPDLIINEIFLLLTAFCEFVLSSSQPTSRRSSQVFCRATKTSIESIPSTYSRFGNLKTETVASINIPSEDLDLKFSPQQIDYYKMKLSKMDQLSLERSKLQEKVFLLETELKRYDNIKYEVIQDPNLAPHIGPDEILMEVSEMKRKVILADHTKSELECERACVEQLTEKLSQLSANRISEFQKLRTKAQESEILQLELDRLRIHAADMKKLRAENSNLKNKCSELQNAKLANNNADIESSKQCEQVVKLQQEKEALLCTIVLKEIEIVDQEDEIGRLVAHVDRLTAANEAQQEKSKLIVTQLRSDLTAKESYINQMDTNLVIVEEKLKESITGVCIDSTHLQSKIFQLEKECRQYKTKNDSMQDTINSLRKQLEMQEDLNRTYSMELQKRNQVEDVSGAERTLNKKLKSMNRMETILNKSHKAVRKMVENLSRDYFYKMNELPTL